MGTILGLYDTLLILLQYIDTMFDFDTAKGVRKGVKVKVSQPENNIRRMLLDFEKAVFHELSTIQDDRGAIHPLTNCVMNYISLIGKSKKLNHVPLRHLFMMNNAHYILEKIEESKELREIIGDDYMEKLNRNVKQAMTSYQMDPSDRELVLEYGSYGRQLLTNNMDNIKAFTLTAEGEGVSVDLTED
ncbi:exocyst complex component EXO70A1-like [Olea europaea subsp. europaea]|uniref:Exocyst subunit Exo70 family protein n=1 Tax=Olea europaea subsp. europaea TaxID=158383 RepID=A0A8S0TCM2_OLEEU|nr:exocyst complex component EXO70A1-like [Olea europaea subsp. europaea]